MIRWVIWERKQGDDEREERKKGKGKQESETKENELLMKS